jgi:hypothetical protein
MGDLRDVRSVGAPILDPTIAKRQLKDLPNGGGKPRGEPTEVISGELPERLSRSADQTISGDAPTVELFAAAGRPSEAARKERALVQERINRDEGFTRMQNFVVRFSEFAKIAHGGGRTRLDERSHLLVLAYAISHFEKKPVDRTSSRYRDSTIWWLSQNAMWLVHLGNDVVFQMAKGVVNIRKNGGTPKANAEELDMRLRSGGYGDARPDQQPPARELSFARKP